MLVEFEGVRYKTTYYPFFRTRRGNGFDVYNMHFISGITEELLVFEVDNPRPSLVNYLIYCIKEYLLEDDDMLTVRATQIKKDLGEMLVEI